MTYGLPGGAACAKTDTHTVQAKDGAIDVSLLLLTRDQTEEGAPCDARPGEDTLTVRLARPVCSRYGGKECW